MPGHEYAGDDPSGFLTLDQTVAHLEEYAHSIGGDLRTGVETSDTTGVLDGDLDTFMQAELERQATGAPLAAVTGE